MAKKKVSHAQQEKPLQKQEVSVREITPPMDSEASEKLENLKSLNQMLLKEAFERRQQVESLVQSKGSLESELTRSNSERDSLKSELTVLGERAARLELERSVVAVFVAAQVGLKGDEFERKIKGLEMKMSGLERLINDKESEIGRLNGKLSEIEGELGSEREISKRVCGERDDFKAKLNREIEEGKGLKGKLIEFEEKKRLIEREIDELRRSYDAVKGEKQEMEMMIKSVMAEKDSTERNLVESNKLIEEMKETIRAIVREKEEIEEEKNVEMVRRQELESASIGLNEMVVNLQNEEVKLRQTVAELEKKFVEGKEKQNEMGSEIKELVEENKLSEERIRGLVDEKTAVEKGFSEAKKQLAEQKDKIEALVNEKIAILEAKSRVDDEVGVLENEVAELKAVVLKLEESSRFDLEKIKNLESEVGDYKGKLENVNLERERMEHNLGEEKTNGVSLREKIGELESQVKESHEFALELKAGNAAIFAEKIELESQCEMLKKEIASLKNTITEAQNVYTSMKGKVELADANSETVLNMLKGISAFCLKDDGDEEVDELVVNGEETKIYVMELETIKKAFKSKVAKVEEMKRQLESLQISLKDANKKKNIWTVWSSATTLLAAISLAYVARGH